VFAGGTRCSRCPETVILWTTKLKEEELLPKGGEDWAPGLLKISSKTGSKSRKKKDDQGGEALFAYRGAIGAGRAGVYHKKHGSPTWVERDSGGKGKEGDGKRDEGSPRKREKNLTKRPFLRKRHRGAVTDRVGHATGDHSDKVCKELYFSRKRVLVGTLEKDHEEAFAARERARRPNQKKKKL